MVTDFRLLSPANRKWWQIFVRGGKTAGFRLELNVTQRPRRNIVTQGVVGVRVRRVLRLTGEVGETGGIPPVDTPLRLLAWLSVRPGAWRECKLSWRKPGLCQPLVRSGGTFCKLSSFFFFFIFILFYFLFFTSCLTSAEAKSSPVIYFRNYMKH